MGGKVGVITLPGQFNYGNRLQLFATLRVYESLGYSPVSLELESHLSPFEALGIKIKNIMRSRKGERPNDNPERLSTKKRLDAFGRFSERISTQYVRHSEDLSSADFEYFSVGSDQVWNCAGIVDRYDEPLFLQYIYRGLDQKRSEKILDWYFLGFAPREKRVALSPSIGLDKLDYCRSKLIACGVSHFDQVSIREKRGAELIKESSGVNAKVICDPTLVLPAEEWRAVADSACTPSEPYVFTYLLGGIGAEAADVLDNVTNHGRLPVVPLSDRQKPGELDAGPAEFIDLIDRASHVVTDSFHAAVFSSILHTPLTIVHREGGASMFSRLQQLSEMLGIEEKVYGSSTFDVARAGEFDGVDGAIAFEREKFLDYLKGCLNG